MANQIKTQGKFISKNPLVRGANEGFLRAITDLARQTQARKILDCGCGEGVVLSYLIKSLKNRNFIGFDSDKNSLKLARQNAPSAEFSKASIYKMPYSNDFCPLLLCTEVLEHLERPNRALAEIRRVTSRFAIISVPHEPYFRLANILRLAYLKSYGNTPGHINHWSAADFKRLLNPYFRVKKVIYPFPWMVFLLEKK